ncbi:MAG: hypothetical protein PHI68_00555 [Candidatus Cloacimonetes bacterium]|nr:hypothetical protein [Candidatus Cloacimonadota bacterium]
MMLLLAVCSTLSGQGKALEFYLSDNDNSTFVEQNLLYATTPYRDFSFVVRASSSQEKRSSFNQSSSQNRMSIEFIKHHNYFNHKLESGYEYYYDKSDLQTELLPYLDKSAFFGYGLHFFPYDSLGFYSDIRYYNQNERDRYMEHRTMQSDGVFYNLGTDFSFPSHIGNINLKLNQEELDLDWRYNRTRNLSSRLEYYDPLLAYDISFSLQDRKDDLYIQQQFNEHSSYQLSDTQARESIFLQSTLKYQPSYDFGIEVLEQYSQRKIRMQENLIKNNADFNNTIYLKASYLPTASLHFENQIRHDYGIKDFSYTKNSRYMDIRGLSTSLSWEYSDGDTLTAGYQSDLQRTEYPDNEHLWDNDLLSQYFRVGWIHYYKSRLRFNNWLIWSKKEDRYIKALLSAANNVLQSLSLEPEIKLIVGDRFLLTNSYQIRADYTRYQFPELKSDNFYRQLKARYACMFDSYPLLSKSGDASWLQLPYRTPTGNAFSSELSFEFELNEYGDRDAGFYAIATRNRKLGCGLNIKHDIGNIYYTIQPKYSWGSLYDDDWQEYALLIGVAWQMNPASLLELSLNPRGEFLDKLDWRINLSINIQLD